MKMDPTNECCSPAAERTRATRTHMPRCDVYEAEGAIHILAEMPGVDSKSIEVSVDRHILTLVGRFEAKAYEGYRLVHGESLGGEFRRSFELSNDTDTVGIQAQIKNGILTVVVPKAKTAQRRIPVLAN